MRSPLGYKRQNMSLKINLICIWHHQLVHCFPFCLKSKSAPPGSVPGASIQKLINIDRRKRRKKYSKN